MVRDKDRLHYTREKQWGGEQGTKKKPVEQNKYSFLFLMFYAILKNVSLKTSQSRAGLNGVKLGNSTVTWQQLK